MKLKSEAGDKLNEFIKDVGIPELLVTDNAGEETGAEWERIRKNYLVKQKWTEPYSPWQNKTEREIQNLKKQFRRIMNRVKAPETLWDFGLRYVSDIRNIATRLSLDDRTPYEVLKGETQDISELKDFEFYEWVKFYEPNAGFTEQRVTLGRWLGVAHDVGQAMCYWILKKNGHVVARSTVRPLTLEEKVDIVEQENMKSFNEKVNQFVGEFNDELVLDYEIDEPESEEIMTNDRHVRGDTEKDEYQEVAPDSEMGVDPTLKAEILLPQGDRHELAKVVGRKRDNDGILIGRKHKLPQLDSRRYVVRWPDGEEDDFAYNMIAEHLYSQVDVDGNQYQIFRDIIDHRKNTRAVDKADQYRTIG
ncbi:MAG: hypothetical protein ACREOZ_04835, partial [Gloeomargaritales cyanobacterium]